jgi:hypothetical protein
MAIADFWVCGIGWWVAGRVVRFVPQLWLLGGAIAGFEKSQIGRVTMQGSNRLLDLRFLEGRTMTQRQA